MDEALDGAATVRGHEPGGEGRAAGEVARLDGVQPAGRHDVEVVEAEDAASDGREVTGTAEHDDARGRQLPERVDELGRVGDDPVVTQRTGSAASEEVQGAKAPGDEDGRRGRVAGGWEP